jgi:bifunctional non-homologous end joining protein LigD
MLWDRGRYYVYGEQPVKSLREGKLHLVLDGEKAKGEWTLVRIRSDEAKNQWLILKTGSSSKPLSKRLDDQSVKSGRTMKQIAEERDVEWQSNRKDESPTRGFRARIRAAIAGNSRGNKKKDEADRDGEARAKKQKVGRNLRARRQTKSKESKFDGRFGETSLPAMKPRFIEPMKPRLVEKPPAAGDWIYELKFDGIRAIAVKDGGKVNLFSRNGNELRTRFPEIADAVKELSIQECVIDGEIVALDSEGRSSFQLLQALEMEGRKSPVRFYLFDLLQLEGKSLIKLPLAQRKELLAKLCEGIGDPIRFSGELGGDARSLLAEVKRRRLEGIVGKERNSFYEPGRRSGAWIKLKCVNEQEFVIGGYTPPGGSRKYFGAILVGYYKDRENRLLFAGKVGTGFNSKSLSMLHKKFLEQKRDNCPFADLPLKQSGKWVQGITPSMMRKIQWVNPVFVCQVKFAEWTRDGKLRQPVFLGLREDKAAREISREG